MARPSSYRKKYCEMLIEHMAQGLSYESFAGLVGVTRDCLYKWEARHKEFLYSKRIGKERMLLYLEKMGLSIMAGQLKGANASTYIFTMKNKCGWTDKVEQEIVTDSPITINYKKDE